MTKLASRRRAGLLASNAVVLVAVTHVQVPGSCSIAPLFVDGFESGGLGDWSAFTP